MEIKFKKRCGKKFYARCSNIERRIAKKINGAFHIKGDPRYLETLNAVKALIFQRHHSLSALSNSILPPPAIVVKFGRVVTGHSSLATCDIKTPNSEPGFLTPEP